MLTGLIALVFPLRLEAHRLNVRLSRPFVETEQLLTGKHRSWWCCDVQAGGGHMPNGDWFDICALALGADQHRHLPSRVRDGSRRLPSSEARDRYGTITRWQAQD
jgi:hypothetical protein